ncbi:TonB-dependent receptor plug domain-containing protein [Mucilaginibacter celer]|uniref:TonB-dependent receptor n=1 Tax=Mucilaginibacter celer TaxID=2305508 RepID=A0A494VUP4_9SPHI|nr:TonB-dependent receptor [Mucilaginibacter celer]AYL97771.1 TonB-dependent receptor [Mucilaginibacter celer]
MDLTVRQTPAKRNGCIQGIVWLVSFGMASVFCCAQVSAQNRVVKKDTTQKDSAKIHQLKQVEIKGAKADVRNISPTPVQVLKGEQLQRLNSLSVADALRLFSGVQLKDYGGVGGLKTVNIRSLGSSHVAIFYDGVELQNAQNGQVDLGRFSLDNMDEVDLYNGQKSETFQAAKGFSAASSIYLQSAKPKFEPDEHTHIRFGYKTGSFGLNNPSVLWQQKINKNTSAYFSTEWIKANGRYKFRYTNGVYDTTAVRNNTDVESYRVEGGINSYSESGEWNVKVYSYTSNRGLPGAIVSNKFNYTQRQWDRNQFIQANYESNSHKRYTIGLIAKYADDYLRYLDPEFVTTTGFLDNRFNQHELYFSVANRYRILPVWDVDLSTDYLRNTLDANLYRFPYPTRNQELVSLASQLKLKRFNLQASVLGTFVDDRVKLYEGAGNKTEYTPAVTASLQVSPDLMLRAFYKNIFRLPTLNELYYTFVGNTLLKPEYAKQYDIGATYNRHFVDGFISSFSIQADAYYNKVKDKIIAAPGLNLFRWTMYNLGDVNIKGAEVNMQLAKQVSRDLSLNATINYTWQQAFYTDNGITYHYNIPYVPTNSVSFTASADYKSFGFNYSYLYTGSRYSQLSDDQNHIYNYLQPWYTHDLAVNYLTKIYRHKTRFSIEVNNILNQDREIIANFPMPRRFYRFKLSYSI